jgi:hypothetical protein
LFGTNIYSVDHTSHSAWPYAIFIFVAITVIRFAIVYPVGYFVNSRRYTGLVNKEDTLSPCFDDVI